MKKNFVASMLCGVYLVALSVPARAQEGTSTTGQSTTGEAGIAADKADASISLDEVIVTAQRREENLQRIGVAVSAVTSKDLLNAGISQSDDLGKVVPSLQVQPTAGTTVSIYLRGVGTQSGNAYAENAVAFNFNGIYIGRPTAAVGTFFDLQRVEVVKGPQGTLYGRNATGGAINVIPNRPALGELSGAVDLEYGNYDNKRGSAFVNLPLGDKVALRLAGQAVDRDGYLSDGTQDEHGQAGRLSLLFQPSSDWSAVLVADYFHAGGKGQGGVLAPGSRFPPGTGANTAPPLKDRIGASDPISIAALASYASTLFGPPFCGGFGNLLTSGCVITPANNTLDSNFYGVSATIEGDIGFGTLTVIPAYRRTETNEDGYIVGFRINKVENTDQKSLEVRLASRDDQRLRYVLGGFYFAEDQDANNFFTLGTLSTNRFTPKLSTDSKAVFAQLTFDVSDTFRLIGGARYTDETKDALTRSAAGGLPGAVLPPLGSPFSGHLNFKKTTWKAGAEWDVRPRSLIYANVATGFKSGGFYTALPPQNTFGPENLTAYTIGSKNRFLDNRLQINVEGFYWDYTDQQVSFVGGINTAIGVQSGGITVNAGKAKIYGTELEAVFALTDADRFTANVQYLHGSYDSLVFDAFSSTGGAIRQGCTILSSRLANPGVNAARFYTTDCSGMQTLNSPEWTTNLGYQHVFELSSDMSLTFGANTQYVSSRQLALNYLPETRQGAYHMSDAYLMLEGPGKRWSVAGYINNIEDTTVLSFGGLKPVVDVAYVALRPPRTYGVRMGYRF